MDQIRRQKRQDLQSLRGIAILAVLLFHFFPARFPNGYVGVDQFFVLSGYLIAMIMDSKVISAQTIGSFYYRRIKRIVPLYSFVVFIVLIALFTLFPAANLQMNMRTSVNALTFTSNIATLSPAKDYAEMFYLLVPTIFLIHDLFKFRIYSFMFVGSVSFIYSMATYDAHSSFNNVFARLWQFSIGMISHLIVRSIINARVGSPPKLAVYGNNTNSESDGSSSEIIETRNGTEVDIANLAFTYFILSMMLIQQFTYLEIPATILRFNVTIMTGAIIVLGSTEVVWPLSNRILIYLGDISYALYLVHWPIYTYVKLTKNNSNYNFHAMAVSIVVAIAITEKFEKLYSKLNKLGVVVLIAVNYTMTVLLLLNSKHIILYLEPQIEAKVNYVGISRENAISLNKQWLANDLPQLRQSGCVSQPNGRCVFPSLYNVSGPSILVWGNSYAANVAGLVAESCGKIASKISMDWEGACDILIPTKRYKHCHENQTNALLDRVRIETPDVMILVIRYWDMTLPGNRAGSIIDDPIYIDARARLAKYEELVTNTIFILNAMPLPKEGVDSHFISKLENNTPLNLTIFQSDMDYSLARERLAALVKNCSKCRMFDFLPYLSIKGEYQFYDKDTLLSYFTDSFHFTPLGLDRIKPAFKYLCDSLHARYSISNV